MFKEHGVCESNADSNALQDISIQIYMATTLTVSGHVTIWYSTPCVISYRCSIVTKSTSPAISEIIGPEDDLSRSRDVIGHVTNRYAISYWYFIGTESLSSTVFEISPPQKKPVRTNRNTDTRRRWFYILSHAIYCTRQTIRGKVSWSKIRSPLTQRAKPTQTCTTFYTRNCHAPTVQSTAAILGGWQNI